MRMTSFAGESTNEAVENCTISRLIEDLHQQLSRNDSLYGSYHFEMETRKQEARSAADLLIRLAGSLTALEVEQAQRRMLEVVRRESDWRKQMAQSVLNRLPPLDQRFRSAMAGQLVQRITGTDTPSSEAVSAANDLVQLIPDLPKSDKALIGERFQCCDANAPAWKREIAVMLLNGLEFRDAHASQLVDEITKPGGAPEAARKHLKELFARLATLEQDEVDSITRRVRRWAAAGPPWKREIACQVIQQVMLRTPVAPNPFSRGLRQTCEQLSALRYGLSDLAPSAAQAAALVLVLLLFCLLWPCGIALVVTDSLWRLIMATACKLQYQDRNLVEKMPDTVALCVYLAFIVPAAVFCIPLLAIGFFGKSITGVTQRAVSTQPISS